MVGLCAGTIAIWIVLVSTSSAQKSPGTPSPEVCRRATESVVQVRSCGGTGSGVVMDTGLVVTSISLVGPCDTAWVLQDGRNYQAHVVVRDASTGVAVLKVDSLDLPPLQLGNSDSLEVSQLVLAVQVDAHKALEWGPRPLCTLGVVSGLDRKAGGSEGLILTDVHVVPGGLGGALVDMKGRLVGVLVFEDPKILWLSYAVPVNRIKPHFKR